MAVGGGEEHYVCYATYDNKIFHNLVMPTRKDDVHSDEMVYLVVGEQGGYYHGWSCVSLDMVTKATKTFSELGELDKDLEWRED